MNNYGNKNELQKHQNSDSIKWLLTLIAFVLVGVILTGIIAGWFDKTPEKEESNAHSIVIGDDAPMVYNMPKRMTFTSKALMNATRSNAESVDVTIQAVVYPLNAANQKVDFSIAWKEAPEHGSEDVKKYVTVTQAKDGDTTAVVSCFKAFDSDTIELKVTTRDGGFTDTCIIKYKGTALSMDISSTELEISSTNERGEYYELGTGKTYNFNIEMDNAFNSVGIYNLSATINATGTLYFGDGSVDAWSGMMNFSEIREIDLSQFMDSFIESISINGTTLSVTTSNKCVEDFYEEKIVDEEYLTGTQYINRYVYFDEFGFTVGNDYESKAQENLTKINSCYFTIKVTDAVSGISDEINLWLVQSVTGVDFNNSVIEY